MKFIFTTILLLSWVGLAAQNSPAKSSSGNDPYETRKKTEPQTAPFSPVYFNNPEQRHLAIIFRLEGNKFVPVESQLRSGPQPYFPKTGGAFQVEYLDSQGKSLGQFYIQNPTIFRSCDGEKEEVIVPVPNGTIIELYLPNNPAIDRLNLSNTNNSKQQYRVTDLGRMIKKGRG